MEKAEAITKARNLLLNESHGVLSTHALDMPGYPFGSLVPYSTDSCGQPVILISDIAQHTKNIKANNKVSLTIVEPGQENVQAHGRLTYIADVKEAKDPAVQERYFNDFPEARRYGEAHNFGFYILELVRARFIGGFGAIFWIEKDELLLETST